MARLEHGRFCDEIAGQTGLLLGDLEEADLSATIPTAPDWSLSDLVRHIGGNLRSVTLAVRTGTAVTEPERQVPGHAGPPGDDLSELGPWLSEAAGTAARTLAEAGPDTEAQLWQVRWPAGIWARRAAHDIVAHRADAAGTVGAGYTVAPDLAADALDELLDLMSNPAVAGPGSSGPEATTTGTVHLHASDTGPDVASEWLIELAAPTFTWRHAHEKASVAVRAPIADVLRVAYRRLPPDSDGVEVLGERAVLNAWLERMRLQ
jgi:uncharacterized protein (TIGR03083 family)